MYIMYIVYNAFPRWPQLLRTMYVAIIPAQDNSMHIPIASTTYMYWPEIHISLGSLQKSRMLPTGLNL